MTHKDIAVAARREGGHVGECLPDSLRPDVSRSYVRMDVVRDHVKSQISFSIHGKGRLEL